MRHSRRPILASLVFAVAVAAAGAGVALGAVTFDPASAQGYVAKTDVQAAFGWRDQTLQANAGRVSFHLFQRITSSWSCVSDGVIQQMITDVEASSSVASIVATTAGKHNRPAVSGFSLTGFAAGGGPVTAIVPSCPAGSPADVIAGETDVLYADFQGQSRAIWSR